LDKNKTVINATGLTLNELPTLNILNENTITGTLKYTNITPFKQYYENGYLGYLYKHKNNQNHDTLFMLYKVSDNVPDGKYELGNDCGMSNLLHMFKKLRILLVIKHNQANNITHKINKTKSQNDIYKPNVIKIIRGLLGIVSNSNNKNIIKPIQKIGSALSQDTKIYPIHLPINKNKLSQTTLTQDIMNIGIYVKLIDKESSYGLIIRKIDKFVFIPVSVFATYRDDYNSITWESIKPMIDINNDIKNIIHIYGYSEPTDLNIKKSLITQIKTCLNNKCDTETPIMQALCNKHQSMNIIHVDNVSINSRPFITSSDIIMMNQQSHGSTTQTPPSLNQYPKLIIESIRGCNSINSTNNTNNQRQLIESLLNQLGILYADNTGKKTILYIKQNNELKEMPLRDFTNPHLSEKPVKYVLVTKG
jgi:hypothetical protein